MGKGIDVGKGWIRCEGFDWGFGGEGRIGKGVIWNGEGGCGVKRVVDWKGQGRGGVVGDDGYLAILLVHL